MLAGIQSLSGFLSVMPCCASWNQVDPFPLHRDLENRITR
jgi:hypothetical protein